MKLAVYTCITGGYDIPPAIWQKDKGVDYICFTDDPEMQSQDWAMMPIPHGLMTSDKAKTAKLVKASPHLLLKDYGVSVWVDGDVEIRGSVKQFLQKYNLAQFSFWACPHGVRRDLFDEVFYAARYKKDLQQTLYRQSNRYRNEGMPDKYGLCDTSVLVRVHSRTACQQICQCWQREILAGSAIDRISLPYSIWRVKGSVGFLSENLTSGTGAFYRKDCHERYVKPIPGLLAVKTPNKTVVYTCITGGYDALRPISRPDPNIDYVCFTDNPATHAAGWTIRPVPEDLAGFSKVKQQRLVKIRPDKYLAEYDVSLWLDANLVVSCDLHKDFISKLDLDRCPLWTKKHPQRSCVYDEAKSVVKLQKDTQENVDKQVDGYRRFGYPARNGLAETNIMLRRHKDPLVVKAMEIWSKELSEKSHRDQLSFDFACWKAGLKYGRFEKKDVEKLIRLERHCRREYAKAGKTFLKIVIPNFNNKPYIGKCLDSILTQTFRDFKIVVVDDLSTDGSDRICEQYAAKFPDKVTFIRMKKKGHEGGCRNAGIDCPIDCEYYMFVDGDDWLKDDTCLQRLHDYVAEDRPDVLIYCLTMLRNGKYHDVIMPTFDWKPELIGFKYSSACTKLVKKEKMRRFLENCDHAADTWWTMRIFDQHPSVKHVKDVIYVYNRNQSSVTLNGNYKRDAELFYVKFAELLKEITDPVVKMAIENRIFQYLDKKIDF